LVLPLIAFFLAVLVALWLLPLQGLLRGGRSVLVLYDEPDPAHPDLDRQNALMLRQLLGHFESGEIDLVSTGEYKAGAAKDYDIVFYLGTKEDVPLPTYLLDDLFFRKETLVWIGGNLDKMASRHSLESFGIRLLSDTDQHATNRVDYKGKQLWKLDTRTFQVDVVNQVENKVLAWAIGVPGAKPPSGQTTSHGPEVTYAGQQVPEKAAEPAATEALPPIDPKLNFEVEPFAAPTPEPGPPAVSETLRLPWIVQGKRLWYVASDPFSYAVEGSAYLAFCDVLHDIMKSGVKGDSHPGLVRLEDVHAQRNGADLLAAADYLKSREITFAFTVVPVYVNPETKETLYLSNAPEFLQVVHGLVARGGVPVLHGYTHQNVGETAVDYEFWNEQTDRPVAQGPEFAAERVLRGLSECFLADVYPVAWTTPHYAASQIDYDSIKNYFTTALERRQPIDKLGSDQFFPYVIYHDLHKQIVLPENLGYVQPAAGRDPAAILQDAENSLVVRDGWGSFFFHTFLDLKLLREVVEGMEKLGYEWTDLRQYNNKVRTEDTVVVTGVGEIDLNLKSQYLNTFTLNPRGEKTDETFSFRTVTGQVNVFSSVHEGEIQVYQGVYAVPPLTWGNLGKFRPTISGLTSPVAIFLLFVGLAILFVFLTIWIFLLTRKATNEVKSAWRARGRG
jgi:hypothetical protein